MADTLHRMSASCERVERKTWSEHWFAGLPWTAIAIGVCFSVVNALRRNANSRLLWEAPLDWLEDVAVATLTGVFVAVPVIVAVVFAFNRLTRRGWRFYAAMVATVAIASACGTALLVFWEKEISETADNIPLLGAFQGTWPRYMMFGLLFAGAYVYFRSKRDGAAAMQQLELDRIELEQRMAEARLTVLLAQIEPHFLFNTLANVKSLYATDPVAAEVMLDNLMRYLAVALPQMRENESTLAREANLVAAYLNIQKVRMGRRLEFAVDVPDRIGDTRMRGARLRRLRAAPRCHPGARGRRRPDGWDRAPRSSPDGAP